MSRLGRMGEAAHSLIEELDIINDDLRNNLSVYIANEEKKAVFTEESQKVFLEALIKPEIHLRDYEANDINNKKNSLWHTTPNIVDIVSFNYTRTIEFLLGDKKQQCGSFMVNMPEHVHGFHNNRMILGVNDISQIDNEELRKNSDAVDTLVKSRNNHTYGEGHTKRTSSLISTAQLLCLFGLSLGETDKMWWNLICQELNRRKELVVVIFWYDKTIFDTLNGGAKLQRIRKEVVNKLLSFGDLKPEEKESIANRIYVAINKPLFNFKIDKNEPNLGFKLSKSRRKPIMISQ